MKRARNELLQFLGGLAMLVVGLFIFSQKVMVSSSFWGIGMRLGSFHMSNGMIMIPFIIGIVWMFASGGSVASKVLTGAGVLFIIVSVVLSTHITMERMTLYEWILILVLIFGGAGMLAKILFSGSPKDVNAKADDSALLESRRQIREIEKEVEKMKKGQ